MLTFDDGLKDHFRIINILEKFKIKGLFLFVQNLSIMKR